MTTIDMIAMVSTTTPTNASVSRACRLRGTMRAGTMRRSSPLSPEVGARPPVIWAGAGIRASASATSTVSKVSTGSAAGSLSGSALGEGVADSPHGQDEGWRGGIVLDLLAQVADVDVDRLLVLVERLVVARCQHEHRRLRPSGAQPAQDLEPVDAGQPDVEDDEVGRLVDREVEPVLARPGDGYLVALLLERVLDPAGNRELVFDDEDGGGHRWRDATPKVPHGRSAGAIGVDRRARAAPCDTLPRCPGARRYRSPSCRSLSRGPPSRGRP